VKQLAIIAGVVEKELAQPPRRQRKRNSRQRMKAKLLQLDLVPSDYALITVAF
jgi:hypothetical protein